MPLAAGTTFGPYQVTAKIGEGGMGEVYQARDTKLDRDVALKVLPEAFTADSDRLTRFEREAKVLASLNHPNIASIYGLEEAAGVQALVLELVEGPTLADRIKQGPLSIDEALPIARQIAEALEAAHETGVIHRDLKPANIKVRQDGTVKVLDFGLAKELAGEAFGSDLTQAPTVTARGTREGELLGTPAYMSPEQARGQKTNRQTDIWSFGCVLYEMLTGAPAFHGATVSDTIVRVLEHVPDWTALPAATPDGLRRLLGTCLERDGRRRWRNIGDVGLVLQQSPSSPYTSHQPALEGTWTGRRIGIEVAVAASLIAATAFWLGTDDEPAPGDLFSGARFTSITNFQGDEYDATISPDGRFVAFVANGEGVFDAWLSQVDTGSVSNPTLGQAGDVRGPFEVRSIGFHGDGSQLWIGGAPWKRMGLIPLVGGSVRNVFGETVVNADWSPDGARVVYHPRWTPQKRPLVDTSKPAISGMAETGGVLPRGPRLAQVGADLGAPAAWPALEHVGVVQQAVEEGRDGRGVAQQLAPVVDRSVRR